MFRIHLALVTSLTLISCVGPSNAPGAGNAALPGAPYPRPSASREFSGEYAGYATYVMCEVLPSQGIQQAGDFEFRGSGKNSEFARSKEIGAVFQRAHAKDPNCRHWEGSVTLKADGSRDEIDANLEGPMAASPCGESFSYAITGGKGKYEGATGKGTVTFQCSTSGSGSTPYSDKWSGTIHK